MKNFIAKKTVWIRHKIAKLIVPHIYESALILSSLVSATPRPMILTAKSHFERTNLVGVEIGVKIGDNALSILQTLSMKTLYLIDPYFTFYEEDIRTVCIPLEAYGIAKKKLARFPQVKFIIKTSDEACKDICEPLDFVYIDGNHTYEYVKRDITNYYPLIKSGGMIGGHNYSKNFDGVIRASIEFARENGLELHTGYPDWWIFKND